MRLDSTSLDDSTSSECPSTIGVTTVEFVVELLYIASVGVHIGLAKSMTLSLVFALLTLGNFFLMVEANLLPELTCGSFVTSWRESALHIRTQVLG